MRSPQIKYPAVIITFKKKNGEMWEETYSSLILDIFKNDPDVYEIRYRDSDELIYRREN